MIPTDPQADPTEDIDGAGESQGGAYPNPHSGTSGDTPTGGKDFKDDWGGENGVGYHGGGQAGGTYAKDDATDSEGE